MLRDSEEAVPVTRLRDVGAWPPSGEDRSPATRAHEDEADKTCRWIG